MIHGNVAVTAGSGYGDSVLYLLITPAEILAIPVRIPFLLKKKELVMRRKLRTLVTCFLFLLPVSNSLSEIRVLSVTPLPQSMDAGSLTEVTVQFDSAVDASTISGSTVMILGRWSGISGGTFTIESSGTLVRFVPSLPFSAGEWVTIALSKHVLSETGDSLSHAYAWNFWIKSSPGTIDLTETARLSVLDVGETHVQPYGAHAADMNHDGFTDLTIPNEVSNDVRMFLNDGSGGYSGFSITPIPNGSSASANEAGDLTGDGDLDYVVGSGGNDQMCVFIGDGSGGFTSATSYPAGSSVRGVSLIDLEGDGDLDIITANRNASNLSIFRNNGDGTLQPGENMEANGSQETACAAADANNDGILDLFVGAYGSGEMILLLGDGNGGLVFSTKVSAGGSPWQIGVGDVNGDGNVDVVSANSTSNNASVILGDGQGGLSAAITYPVGNFVLAVDLGDIDGDGDLDMVTSNYISASWTLYENDGDGIFINQRTLPSSGAGSCATLHDRDNDGDLDMTGIDEEDDLVFLFNNELASSVDDQPAIPLSTELLQNYPNPFNSISDFGFRISDFSHVSLAVYDLLGREVTTLVDETLSPGVYRRQWNASDIASGVYFYRLTAGEKMQVKKLIVNK